MSYNEISYDPYAGGVAPNGKDIWSPDEAADNLVRPGYTWAENNYGELDDGVLTYGFWTYDELLESYYVNEAGTVAFNEAFYAENYGLFEAFTLAQQTAAAGTIELWDDLIAVDFELAESVYDADITFGATYMSPAAGAYAYYPSGDVNDAFYEAQYGFIEAGRRSGDVWINWLYNSPTGEDGFLPRNPDTSFSNLEPGAYGWWALAHELGHSLGLAHGGDYNASDDEVITYNDHAYFYQDSNQYTIMSYFSGSATGAGWVDWQSLTFRNPSTPMVHDILAVQQLYGADLTTRTDDTVYGFNSNAGNAVYDFTANTAPVLTIYDAGGNDTLDLSGWNTDSLIDINEGAFSSAGEGASLEYLKSIGFLPQSYTQAQLENLYASYNSGSQGQMTDNIAIAYGTVIENAVGGGGNDVIIGNDANNKLYGGDGDDILIGGAGKDELFGGAGNDIFVFTDADLSGGNDKIRDFETGDRIDLSAFAIDESAVKIAGSNLFVDTDGVKGYDLHIIVQGDSLQATDIIFA